jgi:hypothetical protein
LCICYFGVGCFANGPHERLCEKLPVVDLKTSYTKIDQK